MSTAPDCIVKLLAMFSGLPGDPLLSSRVLVGIVVALKEGISVEVQQYWVTENVWETVLTQPIAEVTVTVTPKDVVAATGTAITAGLVV